MQNPKQWDLGLKLTTFNKKMENLYRYVEIKFEENRVNCISK